MRFEQGGNILFADYEATTVDTGSDDTIDSDATGVNGTDKKLSYAYIAGGIEMPAEKDVQGNVYEVKHQDLGLVEAKEETVDIPVRENLE